MAIWTRKQTRAAQEFLGYIWTPDIFPKRIFEDQSLAYDCIVRLAEENTLDAEFPQYFDSEVSVQKAIEYNAKLGDKAKKALSGISTPAIEFLAQIGNVVNNSNDAFTGDEIQWILAQLLSRPNPRQKIEGYPSVIATHKNAILHHARVKSILVEYKRNFRR